MCVCKIFSSFLKMNDALLLISLCVIEDAHCVTPLPKRMPAAYICVSVAVCVTRVIDFYLYVCRMVCFSNDE